MEVFFGGGKVTLGLELQACATTSRFCRAGTTEARPLPTELNPQPKSRWWFLFHLTCVAVILESLVSLWARSGRFSLGLRLRSKSRLPNGPAPLSHPKKKLFLRLYPEKGDLVSNWVLECF